MPKRIQTPPPPEDEPRYLVVVHPYPLNANLQLHGHRRSLALWLACFTGKDALLAMFHKPSSPGMIIIEVDRDFERFDSLLGQHTWSKFLKNPTPDDMDKSSKIFWCRHNTGRKVQKEGWKRVDVEEHWFNGWSPDNNVIKHPYPKSTYCEVPVEAQTGVPLCRPLPQNILPKPAPAKPSPTVGSREWVQTRSNTVPSDAPASPSRRRTANQPAPTPPAPNQPAPSVVSSMTTGSGPGARAPPPSSPVSAWVAEQRIQVDWSRPPPSMSSISSLSPSTASSSVGDRIPSTYGVVPTPASYRAAPPPSTHSTSTHSTGPPPVRPPGLARPPSSFGASTPQLRPYEHFDWSDEVEICFQADQEDVQSTAGGSTISRGRGGYTAPPPIIPDSDGAIEPDQDYDYDEEDRPRRSTAHAMTDLFDKAPSAMAVRNNTGLHDVEEEDLDYVAYIYPEALSATTQDWSGEAGDNSAHPWADYRAPRLEPPTKVNIKAGEEWRCSQHGPMCNPGICKERRHLEKQRQDAKEVEDRQNAKEERMRRKKAREERSKRKENEESRPLRYRGAGGSSSNNSRGSGSDSDSGGESDDGSQDAGSVAGSDEPTPPPLPPSGSVAGPEDCGEQEPLWDAEDETPRVSLPSGSSRSVTGSNSNSNNKNNGKSNNILRGTAAASRQQPTWGAPPAAASVSALSSAAPSEWDDDAGSQDSAPFVRPGDVRGAASVRSAATSVSDAPTSAQSPAPRQRQSSKKRYAASAWTPTSSTRDDVSAGAQSPAPGQDQSIWDTRSAASARTTTSSIRNDRSTGPDSDVAPVPRSGQQNGRQKNKSRSGSAGASSSTQSNNRSTGRPAAISAGPSSPTSAGPQSPASVFRAVTSPPPGDFVPVQGGFPTHADTQWGDPIAAALASSKSSTGAPSTASCSAVGTDTGDRQAGGDSGRDSGEAGQGQQQEATGRYARNGRTRGSGGRRNARNRGGAAATARPDAAEEASQDAVVPAEPDVTLPPGGPGEQWCPDDVEW